jgi:CTP:molybdopterin cytidylyltransferase MocA
VLRAVVLAAGLSTRMGGRPKGLLPFDDVDVFVTRIVRTFNEAGLHDVVVVVGHEAAAVRARVEASGLSARTVMNPRYEHGQLSSLQAAIDAVDDAGVSGMVLALVDAPLFSASTVRLLTERFEQTHAPVVRAVRGTEHGHPVILGRALFELIRRADPAVGAKPIVRGHASPAGDVGVDDAGAFQDIDTPDDYARIIGPPAAKP